MDKICEFKDGKQIERDATLEEQAEIDARRSAGPSASVINAPILAALELIDSKSIRAIREGDQERIAAWNAEANGLRAQLIKG